MSTLTICAERTTTLVRQSPLNPLRRLLRKPLPTFNAHLFADAVVCPVPGEDPPTLRIDVDADRGHVTLAVVWPSAKGGTVQRIGVRERGADRFMRAMVAHVHPDPEPGAGEVRLPPRMAAMFAEGVMPAPLPGACPPPTQDTTVLHDVAFIMDQLELAQFQVAMSPGGADAGSVDNAAHVALQAMDLVRAKLEVMGEAADLAAGEVRAADDILAGTSIQQGRAKGSLNRAAAMLRQVTTALPRTTESTHARP